MKYAASAITLFLAICANAQWTVVNLHPEGAGESEAWGVAQGQQVGEARVGFVDHAGPWHGTAGSWVDLHPAGAAQSYAIGPVLLYPWLGRIDKAWWTFPG